MNGSLRACARRCNDFWQHRAWNIEQSKKLVVPVAAMDIEEHRSARVRGVGYMCGAARKIPDEPRIDGAEGELTARSSRTRPWNMIEQPLELGAGEVSVDDEPRLGRDERRVPRFTQRVAIGRGAPVLPDNRVRDGLAGRAFPEKRGLTLVGDAEGRDIADSNAGLAQHLGHYAGLRRPDLHWIVLDPARLRID